MYYGHNPKFPDNFMWGASSAAWQVEGGVADGGRTPAIIDLNSKTKKPFADNTYANACLDRIIHKAFRLELNGKNMRNPV